MALAVPTPPTQPRRVKVYELRNNDWFDRGTGYCTGQLLNDEPHIQVKAEDESDRLLLQTKIIKDDGYQKQQETLIVWTEPQGTDMALSFQEPEGCAAIWEFVSHVQSHHLNGADEILSDDAGEAALSSVVQLPKPGLGTLAEIELTIRQASATNTGRDALAKYIINEDWVAKLLPTLEEAEDLESLDNLHRLCNIMKMVILLNDTLIVESIVSDEMIMGVVGILEYDPDFPSHKANHRQFLKTKSNFKEVVPIRDPEVQKKIHQTYRLQYLKDVVLARILDDPTFSVLNSLIFFNQFDILQHLQGNNAFMTELFSLFKPESEAPREKKKAGIQFIQNCCQIAKSLQLQARHQLYSNFISNGVFSVIDQAMLDSDPAMRTATTDVLVALIDHDAAMVRQYIYRQINEKQKPLTHTLIELLLEEQDMGVKMQIADAMRVLLDHSNGAMDMGKGEVAVRLQMRSTNDTDSEGFLKTFYEDSAKKLFTPLKELEGKTSLAGLSVTEVSLYVHLVETLCFFVRQHSYRSKYFLLTENLPSRVAQLLSSPEKHLKLMALKFFRTCIGLQDDYYIRHMIKHKLFAPILNIIIETMPKDNLLNSACLEFFEFIRRENMKLVISHLVETYRPLFESITYVKIFADIINRYEQNLEAATLQYPSSVATSQSTQPASQQHIATNGSKRWQGVEEMDEEQDAYFNTSDDESDSGDLPSKTPQNDENQSPDTATTPPIAQRIRILTGSPPTMKPLVDYPEDDDDNVEPSSPPPSSSPTTASTKQDSSTPTPSHPAPTPPPGPPKRKLADTDDDGDDDMLDKLAKTQRRDSPGLARRKKDGLLASSSSPTSASATSPSSSSPPSTPSVTINIPTTTTTTTSHSPPSTTTSTSTSAAPSTSSTSSHSATRKIAISLSGLGLGKKKTVATTTATSPNSDGDGDEQHLIAASAVEAGGKRKWRDAETLEMGDGADAREGEKGGKKRREWDSADGGGGEGGGENEEEGGRTDGTGEMVVRAGLEAE
ncbi:DUF625-domain-containing protein [Ascodesmis nigricans]|uniref:DUF625-domain-containing protein n=1 Tax=Ascodesmis nigricans TaxID=341454 RepID=A0A4S2MJ06_9PEZI|nr:DUF625-domain-containing protein [Ascodesmis nigricans]